jgi:hypothetical protein
MRTTHEKPVIAARSPLLFAKAPTCVMVDYEAELAVVIAFRRER